jgi:hypothetical protein
MEGTRYVVGRSNPDAHELSDSELPPMDHRALQRDVIEHVQASIALVRQARETLLVADEAESRILTAEANGLQNKVLPSVRRLELRIPVVATMKAGKSTLINAIAGFRLLPYRKLPMTMLPTEVVLTSRVTKPRMILPAGVSEMLARIVRDLPASATASAEAVDLEKVDGYFADTLAAIRAGRALPLAVTEGVGEINSALTRANDLVRLGVREGVLPNMAAALVEMPRIQCPPPDTLANVVADGLAELVLVDTPGPNEQGMAAHLFPLITQELQAAGAVFLILNFIDMRAQAQAELREQIDAAVGQLGTDRLYVVVNRWDDRRSEDMSEADVKMLAAYEAGLPLTSDADRVFLVSARRAFDFSSFQRAWAKLGEAAWDTPEGHNLGQTVFTDSWPGIRDLVPAEFLNAQPANVWKNSGFDLLLTRAISDLQQHAVPIVLESALSQCAGVTDRLRQSLQLRIASAKKGTEALVEQLNALERDRANVEALGMQMKGKRQDRQDLEKEISNLFDRKSRAIRRAVSADRKGARESAEDGQGKLSEEFDGLHAHDRGDARLRRLLLSRTGPQNIHKFDSEQAAQAFAQSDRERFSAQIDIISRDLQVELSLLVARAEQRVGCKLRDQVQPIAVAAQQRIAETFNVNLSLPVPEFENLDETLELPEQAPDLNQVYAMARKRLLKRVWWTLWLIPVPVVRKVTVVERVEYVVDLDKAAVQYLAAFDERLKQVRNDAVDATGRALQGALDSYFQALDQFLGRYRRAIQAGLDATRLDHDKQVHLQQAYTAIVCAGDALFTQGQQLGGYARQVAADGSLT